MDPLYLKIKEHVDVCNFVMYKGDFTDDGWRALKRSSKDHDHYDIDGICYILILSDCKGILEIIEDDTGCTDDYSVDLDTDDDWKSDLGDYESDKDEDYSPPK